MVKVKKIYNYSISPDKETEAQFKSCHEEPFVTAAALMPDAHRGYVAPIGSVLITKEFIVPAWVGYDIGCGVIAIQLKSKNKNINLIKRVKSKSKEIYSEVKKTIPMGLGEKNKDSSSLHKSTLSGFSKILKTLESKEHDKSLLQHIKQVALRHLGSLGAGNHFISIGFDEKSEKELWLVIHSGSRGVGHEVAKKYMIKSSGKEKGYEKTSPLSDKSKIGKEYLNILEFGLDFALLNRLEMSYRVIDSISKVLKISLNSTLFANKTHNHALKEKGKYIHRKGATPAKKGEHGIIPANMRDGSYLVEGLGNPKFLNSSSHGAGRAMSRKEARKSLSISQFKAMVPNITTEFTQDNLDEAPIAYKPIKVVMDAQKKSVKTMKHIIPLINWQT